MLPNRAVFHLIHLVELALEKDEVSAGLGLLIDQVVLKLLKCVNHLKEVTVVQEELEVTHFSLLLNFFGGDCQRILVEVVLEGSSLVLLQSAYDCY